jgi:endonuclease YncB( thermonuclease family)
VRTGAWAIAVALLALGGGPASADAIAGRARLIDGDTIEVAGTTVRLHGIDAPETGQRCEDGDGRDFPCGVRATDTLRGLIGSGEVSCEGSEHDRYGRLIAVCRARKGGLDLNREMVRLGQAVAYEEYSDDYLPEQIEAFKTGRGLWAGTFDRPATVRAARWQAAQQKAPRGCPIKGNISKAGRVYHAPWSEWYDRTRIDTARGERWFCSEDEAIRAGWRAPYR